MITLLLHTFSCAITSNAFFYLLSKIAHTARTFLLFGTMSSGDFATWATLSSTIFLLLLWIDCGLRKSIPRYAPLFMPIRHHLLTPILLCQLTLLICALPLLLYGASTVTTHYSILAIVIGIYLAEGTNAIIRSLYHAYFHHRFFNQLSSLGTIIEMIITIITIIFVPAPYLLLLTLTTQCIITSSINLIAIIYWSSTMSTINLPPVTQPPPPLREGIQYSLAMWGTTILSSISERNFLLPFIIYCAGITTGNLFKIANDGALFFYRLIIKTIGSADIALLAHADAYALQNNEQNLMQQSVQELAMHITRLIVPLGGILLCILPIAWWFYHDIIVFHAFLIMAIGYIIETMAIPYERLLEIKQHYLILGITYGIYTFAIIIIFFLFYYTWIGFITFIICIQSVRLVIGILMRSSVYYIYHF